MVYLERGRKISSDEVILSLDENSYYCGFVTKTEINVYIV